MKATPFYLTLILFIFGSCEEPQQQLSEGLQVSIGTICGWCIGSEELKISVDSFSYYYDNACTEEDDFEKTFYSTPAKEWKELVNQINLSEFKKLDLNSCHVCADGCDTRITIIDSDYSHEIRFGDVGDIPDNTMKSFANDLLFYLERARSNAGVNR